MMSSSPGCAGGLALLAILFGAAAASAGTPLEIGCTATTDCASAALGIEDGIFAKHGINAKLTLVGLNSNIPAALMSGSLQIGGPTPSVFLQAVDGGLDLVGVAGASSTSPETADTAATVVRAGETVKEAKDFTGKKVGVPGIGAFLDVLFRRWLIQHGVDPKGVSFVEVTFPTMNDVLKSGAVDAVVTAEPVLSRIVKAGTGTVAGKLPGRSTREGAPDPLRSNTKLGRGEPEARRGLSGGGRRSRGGRQRQPRQDPRGPVAFHQAADGPH